MSDFVTHRDLIDPYPAKNREKVVGTCAYCDDDIMSDEYYYEIDPFELIHENCFCDYMTDKYECCLVRPE